MVIFTIFRDVQKQISGFEIKGHAGYAEEGSDIVCSAVSAIAQTALLGLQQVAGLTFPFIREKGWMKCILPKDISAEKRRDSRIILDTMYVGIKSMVKGYSKYIIIEERQVE